MKKIIVFIILTIISILLYFNFEPKQNLNIPIKEQNTFPPKEYLNKLEDMKVQ